MKKLRVRTKLTLNPETLRLLDAKDKLRQVRGAFDSDGGNCSGEILDCPTPLPAPQ